MYPAYFLPRAATKRLPATRPFYTHLHLPTNTATLATIDIQACRGESDVMMEMDFTTDISQCEDDEVLTH